MAFKVGQKVVYPNHGIGIIEQICVRQVLNGEECEFYQLRLVATNSVVMVPVVNARDVGLRPPISSEGCARLFKVLADDFEDPPADWKDRYKLFTDRMRTGDIFEMAEVLKTLVYLDSIKPLSFREKRLLEKARQLVVAEIAEVTRKPVSHVEPMLDEALSRACLKHQAGNGKARMAMAASR
ncbi:MAG TPA: CarD family transcriptional regulator [Blastocatellia bacterium]|nr:CarD family transcriptional regulator [Blastocatellia bacterium]